MDGFGGMSQSDRMKLARLENQVAELSRKLGSSAGLGQGVSTANGALNVRTVQLGFAAELTGEYESGSGTGFTGKGYPWKALALTSTGVTPGFDDPDIQVKGDRAFEITGDEGLGSGQIVWLEPDPSSTGYVFTVAPCWCGDWPTINYTSSDDQGDDLPIAVETGEFFVPNGAWTIIRPTIKKLSAGTRPLVHAGIEIRLSPEGANGGVLYFGQASAMLAFVDAAGTTYDTPVVAGPSMVAQVNDTESVLSQGQRVKVVAPTGDVLLGGPLTTDVYIAWVVLVEGLSYIGASPTGDMYGVVTGIGRGDTDGPTSATWIVDTSLCSGCDPTPPPTRTTITTPGVGSHVMPDGHTNRLSKGWGGGGGGAGGRTTSVRGGGGGQGGGYATKLETGLTPGESTGYVVGGGGAGGTAGAAFGPGTDGTNTTLGAMLVAAGGKASASDVGGTGATGALGDTTYAGGAGGTATGFRGGAGGGGSAGTTAVGSVGTNSSGDGGVAGGAGGAVGGGAGGHGTDNEALGGGGGTVGTAPGGGGGGGGGGATTPLNGTAGAAGQLIITTW